MKQLLLSLCVYPSAETDRENLSIQLRAVRNWNETINLINAHGIIALAAYNIKKAGLQKEIPEIQMAVLENGLLKNILRNTWLTERWKEVDATLSNAGIKHILLKGMALENSLYGSKGLRQMNDNDIYISFEESVNAWHLLRQNGFIPAPLKSPLYRKIMFESVRHLPALYKDGYAIEIHNRPEILTGKKEMSLYNFFEDAAGITVGGRKALTLSREMQILHLVNHFEHHAYSGDCQLRSFTDIKLIDPENCIEFPDNFILNPLQGHKIEYRKAAYRTFFYSIPKKNRLRVLTGDIFPSVSWMKNRYKCSTIKTVFMYPLRTGKLRWLV